jgi:hypothetical protein
VGFDAGAPTGSFGIDGALVGLEVDIAQSGLPNFIIVGLPETTVQEARRQVRAAVRNSGLSFPKSRRYLYCGYRGGPGCDPGSI